MRTAAVRVLLLFVGIFLLMLWVPAVLFALVDAHISGMPLRERWRAAKVQGREILHDWSTAMLDPMDDGVNSGI